ncbi:GNAT family N-acetyltransferase [Flavobacterium sp.]|uniref:GNAT family N-acetyltransferase n=1 Tax=Flavobacterium sp. TaxID=239 RepID=UPI004033C8A7
MDIVLKESGAKGYALALENDKRAGAMTYSVAGEHLIIIDHTEVGAEHKGKDIGRQLLYKLVDMARDKNLKIIPLCPFAAAMFKRSEDIKDVLKL